MVANDEHRLVGCFREIPVDDVVLRTDVFTEVFIRYVRRAGHFVHNASQDFYQPHEAAILLQAGGVRQHTGINLL